MALRLVCFDALFTLLYPRLPVYVQYAHEFEPHFGPIAPESIKRSFKAALAALQAERPAYAQGHTAWWHDVIARTANGAGAQPDAVRRALPVLVPRLLARFSSKEGYALYDDVLPTLHTLRERGFLTALVSNTDTRILSALEDLDTLSALDHVLISESEGVEKPSPILFHRACTRAGVHHSQALHVGDEIEADYFGARKAGLRALLLRRPGEGEDVRLRDDTDVGHLEDIRQINSLREVLDCLK